VTGKPHFDWRLLAWRAVAMAAGLAFFLAAAIPVGAASGDRTLWLHHTHTGKTGKFTYKKNGKYDAGVLRELNVFLADWRTGSAAKMDPALFDLLWEVYQEVGGRQPYNIVSSYREPKTNAMLRASSSGVAENSQHMLGKAMDVFIPGVKLSDLRAAAMRHQVGGVGYYPTSGSPFVHMDTGSVRAWPRMTRAQLQAVFPDGRTLHLPVDGKPLSSQGRAYAQAEWNKCRMVPCNGLTAPRASDTPEIRLAALDPAQRTVSTVDVVAPMPMLRRPAAVAVAALDPATTPFNDPSAPLAGVVPFSKTPALMVATRSALPPAQGTALNAIATLEPAPLPRALMTPRDDEVLTAYAPDANARRALDLLIANETAAPLVAAVDATDLRPAVPAGTGGMSAAANLFDMTWTAVTEAGGRSAIANALVSASLERDLLVGLKPRAFDLVAPEIDHVNETLVEPVPMTDMHFAELYAPEGYLDNAAELGPMASRVALEPDIMAPARYDTFVVSRPLLVAAR
jgi:uncharacterized protein YcbK (DUF882 family)